jgi:hypothetical protein
VHCSLSWFKSRPGLQPSLLRIFGLAGQLEADSMACRRAKNEGGSIHASQVAFGKKLEPVGIARGGPVHLVRGRQARPKPVKIAG